MADASIANVSKGGILAALTASALNYGVCMRAISCLSISQKAASMTVPTIHIAIFKLLPVATQSRQKED